MHPALTQTNHRPWPIPAHRWTWRQSWRDLLFAHWPIDAAVIRPLIPKPLEIHEFDGTSWIGVVPFRMSGVMLRPLPDLPWISAFPELNIRLYVSYQDKPGVWFLSLDATNILAVRAARRFFHLPYIWADMAIRHNNDGFAYTCQRREGEGREQFIASYAPTSNSYEAKSGTLEHWLTERYCLYAQSPRGQLFRAEVHHAPWPLQSATADIHTNELLIPHKITIDEPPALLHFAKRLDVVVWSPERIEG